MKSVELVKHSENLTVCLLVTVFRKLIIFS